jgi:hypothetical protein
VIFIRIYRGKKDMAKEEYKRITELEVTKKVKNRGFDVSVY